MRVLSGIIFIDRTGFAVARRTRSPWPTQTPLQPVEALERNGHLRPDAARTGRPGRRNRHADDRCTRSQDAPNGLRPGAEKGGRGRRIGRTKGGMNSKVHAVTDALGRRLRMVPTAGQCKATTAARGHPWTIPARETAAGRARPRRRLAARSPREHRGHAPASRRAKGARGRTPDDQKLCRKHHKIETGVARLKNWRRVATRYDRCPKLFPSARSLATIVISCS